MRKADIRVLLLAFFGVAVNFQNLFIESFFIKTHKNKHRISLTALSGVKTGGHIGGRKVKKEILYENKNKVSLVAKKPVKVTPLYLESKSRNFDGEKYIDIDSYKSENTCNDIDNIVHTNGQTTKIENMNIVNSNVNNLVNSNVNNLVKFISSVDKTDLIEENKMKLIESLLNEGIDLVKKNNMENNMELINKMIDLDDKKFESSEELGDKIIEHKKSYHNAEIVVNKSIKTENTKTNSSLEDSEDVNKNVNDNKEMANTQVKKSLIGKLIYKGKTLLSIIWKFIYKRQTLLSTISIVIMGIFTQKDKIKQLEGVSDFISSVMELYKNIKNMRNRNTDDSNS